MLKQAKYLIAAAVVAAGALAGAGKAEATPLTGDLTADTYITVGALDWTWAAPVAVSNWYGYAVEAPSFHAGWRYATEAEWAARPSATLFLGDFGVINSARYWSDFTWVDYGDGLGGYLSRTLDSGGGSNDIWYVRDVGNIAANVPEPVALSLLGLGLAGLGIARRRKAA